MSHYFVNDRTLPSALKKTKVMIFNQTFLFYTDNGVFAKKGLDYGSRFLLESLPLETIQGSVLDVGCGYGVFGIILQKRCGVNVTMIDINKRALHLARRNSKENGCQNITIVESNCYENIADTYDVIITNPPIRAGKKVVYEILMNAKEHLKEGGVIYFVIRKEQGAKSIISDLKKRYDVTILNRSKGFYSIALKVFENG